MQFELVSPERSLASMDAATVQIPGADGDMTVMPDHAPVITILRPGILRVDAAGETHEYVVSGGFAEIGMNGVSVLAERAVAKPDMTQDQMDVMFDEAQAAYTRLKELHGTGPGVLDDVTKVLADMAAMGGEVGLTVKQPTL